MIHIYSSRLRGLLPLAFLFLSATLGAQLWPADANNSGRVNGVDLIYWAQQLGQEGYQRANPSDQWISQTDKPWDNDFPNGLHHGFADFNGDGRIDLADLAAFHENFGQTHGVPQDDDYLLPIDSALAVGVLQLNSDGVHPTTNGRVLDIDVELLANGGPIPNFYGLSLRATFTPGLFSSTYAYAEEGYGIVQSTPGGLMRLLEVDAAASTLEATVTAVNRTNRSHDGPLRRLSIPLAPSTTTLDLAAGSLTIDSLVYFDRDGNAYPLAVRNQPLLITAGCGLAADPVCGSNGVTYLNACFAEAAGIFHYTSGACWNPGIVSADIDSTAVCGNVYAPVCGVNGVTYANACLAEAAGVSVYSPGVCDPNDRSCYDPGLITLAAGTSVDVTTGVVSLNCASSTPVCGCDGQQYASACVAEAAGIRTYTPGSCSAGSCLDPTAITGNAGCPTTVDYVCGCNGETYLNPCYAAAAGVQSHSAGPCNGTSGWCNEAVAINCGDFLPGESTVGAGNHISSYPGGSAVPQLGPDRVYVFQKSTAGDLQVGLEILTPGLNMDVFVLRGGCNAYQVVGKSTWSNLQTNNEGIVIEDAPNGTYYIVVDQPAAGPGGVYNLELSCGYLDCGASVPLTCGVPYNGTNAGGTDDVSVYTCGPTLNVENNGPEVVHTFTVVDPGQVSVRLSGLSANLELFLLDACDRGRCVAFSQNPGTNDELILRNVPPGTYYVVVDGFNGAVSPYNLTVDCTASCTLNAAVVAQNDAGCGQNAGDVTIQVTGGCPIYTAHYNGPVCATVNSTTGNFFFGNLPPGTYQTHIVDANGCETYLTFTISSGAGGLTGTTTVQDASCRSYGSIAVRLNPNAQGPFSIYLSGTASGAFQSSSPNFTLRNLPAGNYQLSISDAQNCGFTRNFTVGVGPGNLAANFRATPASCTSAGGTVGVDVTNGNLPLMLDVVGPGTLLTIPLDSLSHTVFNVPAGTYHLTLTDAAGCVLNGTVRVDAGNLSAAVSPIPASCGIPGAARVLIGSGTPPFMVNYSGPVSGVINDSGTSIVVPNLPSGTYNFAIWDAAGCDVNELVFIDDAAGGLGLNVRQLNTNCGTTANLVEVTVSGGQPSYSLTYNGPEAGVVVIGATGVDTLSLPPGSYAVSVSDFTGCSVYDRFDVVGGIGSNSQTSFTFGNNCGQQDNIRTTVGGGTAPYQVNVTTPCSNRDTSFTLSGTSFDLTDLPNCNYTIVLTDANGCVSSQTVTVDVDPNDALLTLTAIDGACGDSGTIRVDISGGTSAYRLNWTGPESDSVVLGSRLFFVRNLPAGTYTFSVVTGDGCQSTQSITLLNDGDLDIVPTIVTDNCGAADQIWVDIFGGTAPYDVQAVRLCDGNTVPVQVIGAGFEIFNVIPCKYKLIVTDATGCMTMDTVMINPYQLFDVLPEDGICDQPGRAELNINNSVAVPPFTLSFTGPVFGQMTQNNGNFNLENLPAGDYTVAVIDANGCAEIDSFNIGNLPSDLHLATVVINNQCGSYDQLWNDVTGGVLPYTVEVFRLCDNTLDTTFTLNGLEFELEDLDSCAYKVKVTDAVGCMVMTTTQVEGGEAELVDIVPRPGPCGMNGRIDLQFTRGTPPYQVVYTGPQSGNNTVIGSLLTLNDVPPGNYNFTITDVNGCTETESVNLELTPTDLTFVPTLIFNDCGQQNQIWVDIFNGDGPYAVDVIRLCDSTVQSDFITGDVGFELFDLTPCEYFIKITDNGGCMVSDTIVVTDASGPQPPVVDFTVTGDDFARRFVSLGDTGTYFWTLGDGTTATDSIVDHTYAGPGDYQVCLTTTNACGSDTLCRTVQVTVGGNIQIILGDGSGVMGGSIRVPVSIQGATNLTSFSGTLVIGDTSVARFSHVSPAAIWPQFNSATGGFSYVDQSGGGLALSGNVEVLFFLHFDLGSSSGSTSLSFSNQPIATEISGMVGGLPQILPFNFLTGSVNTSARLTANVEARAMSFNGDVVQGVNFRLTEPGQSFVLDLPQRTDGTAGTLAGLTVNRSYEVEPSKNSDPRNGISSFEIFLGQRYLLGLPVPQFTDPRQILALDVNCSNGFSVLDLFLMQRLLMQDIAAVPGCDSWRFVPMTDMSGWDNSNIFGAAAMADFTLMTDTMLTFSAVKLGDPLGDADVNRSLTDLPIRADWDATPLRGQTRVVRLTSSEALVSLQGRIALAEGLELVEVRPLWDNLLINTNEASRGRFDLSWFSDDGDYHGGTELGAHSGSGEGPASQSGAEVVMEIAVVIGPGFDPTASPLDFLPGDAVLPSVAHDAGYAPRRPVIVNPAASTPPAGLDLSLSPNPAADFVDVRFTLPKSGETTVTVYDALGRQVQQRVMDLYAGDQALRLDLRGLASGTYTVRLDGAGRMEVRRLVH